MEAAGTLREAGKPRQAGFFVHLAIEKALQAHVVATTRSLPPRSHDLLALVQQSDIVLTESQRDFLGRIQLYCLEGSYPTEGPPAPPPAEMLARDLKQATEMIQW